MKNFTAEEFPEVRFDLSREVRPVIIHSEKDTLDLDWLIEGLTDTLDSVHELGNAFESEELTLDGDEDGI